ncbi:MAG: tRNA pseudouridine(13) synthase TruD [Erysipelotrichaceae bacterium]|nr:tRNA pseudouridine(13) synthase TruD [Erysipelotrichaceae bacterium]
MIIKYIPEDFIVQEVLVTDHSPQYEGQPYMLLCLDKKGYSTFDAMKKIETWFGINETETAGLKDSDGITSQKISIPISHRDMLDHLDEFNQENMDEKSFIHLSFLGYINEPLKPARLEGNVFRLRLRDMDKARAEKWMKKQIYTLVYPNYFDKQRFGIPNHKKQTHLIGEALYNKDFRKAYEYLLKSGTSEASLPFDGDYEKFFSQIDKRVRGFYDSALYSADFNARLGDLLEEGGPVCTVEDEGITFRMPKEKRTMAGLMAEDFPEEEIGTFRVKTLEQAVPRKLLVTTNVNFLSCEDDEFHPGKSVLTVSFFLPMGAYATMAMKQLDIFLQ